MTWVNQIRSWLRSVVQRGAMEREMESELRFHMESYAEDLIRHGVAPDEARRRARIEFGSVEAKKEECRTSLGLRLWDELCADVRFALRMLRKSPGFTVVAVLTLALGIGANSAVFSVVKAVLLSKLPLHHPEQLVYLVVTKGGQDFGPASWPDFRDYQQQAHSLDGMAAWAPSGGNLVGGGEALHVSAPRVTADFFSVFEIKPQLGRWFTSEDYAHRTPVVVLSDALWRGNFGADPSAIGRSVTLSDRNVTIIGVAEPGFQFPKRAELWVPYFGDESFAQNRGSHFLFVAARLKRGATLEAAQAEMSTISQRLKAAYPASNADRGIHVLALREQAVQRLRTILLVLVATVAFVLLIACANIANLYMSRAIARQQELAMRVALGGRPARLIRQLATESTVLALCAGTLGLLLAKWLTTSALRFVPAGTLPSFAHVHIDGAVLAFTAATSIGAGMLFSLAPAWGAFRLNVAEVLKLGGQRSGTSRTANVLSDALVVAQMALAVVLLAAGGLMIRSMQKLLQVDVGFQPAPVLAFETPLPHTAVQDIRQRLQGIDNIRQRLMALPAVRHVAYGLFLPLDHDNINSDFQIAGRPEFPPGQAPVGEMRIVGPDFFPTLGIRRLRGRDFTERDDTGATRVAVINRSLADKFWPNSDPLGGRIGFDNAHDQRIWFQIVGVVDDVHDFGVAQQVRLEVYMPLAQQEPEVWTYYQNPPLRWAIQASGDAGSITSAAVREVHALDPTQPVTDVHLLSRTLDESLAAPRFQSLLLGLFAALGLIIALAGVFSVLSWAVARRTTEIGVRFALGATRVQILRLILGRALKLITLSFPLGITGALLLGRLMRTVLFGTAPSDPLVLTLVVALVAAVAILASCIPARRATRIDPMGALRYE